MLLKNMVVMKICVFGALLACPCRVTAKEEEPMQGLKIESKTEECSADYYIAKEEGQNPDEDEDKKRTCVGIGERVTLTLTGKQALIGENKDIRWTLEDGAHLGSLEGMTDGEREVTLVINDDLSPKTLGNNNRIKVWAYCSKTQQMPDKPLKLEVCLPTHITGKHRKKEGGGRGMIADAAKFPGFPTDQAQDRGKPGASAQLELTIHPTNVNFKNIHVIEKDADASDKTFPPLGGRHRPGETWSQIDPGNRVIDTIAWKKTMNEVKAGLSPDAPEQKWDWACKRYVQSIQHRDVYMLNTVTQSFKVRWTDPRTRKAVHAWISKFECQVERDSQQGTHVFSPQDNK